ncbi:hypothetical protein [Streptomyces sp. YPW6]|uniref:hypothetical protein n=1 Tax=Streptomyces sp. YPW6 TaxID=2840373 RepID=UPI003D7423EE
MAAALTRNPHDTDIGASRILTPAARAVGGGAGGKGPVASAGGRRAEALDEALSVAVQDAVHTLGQERGAGRCRRVRHRPAASSIASASPSSFRSTTL